MNLSVYETLLQRHASYSVVQLPSRCQTCQLESHTEFWRLTMAMSCGSGSANGLFGNAGTLARYQRRLPEAGNRRGVRFVEEFNGRTIQQPGLVSSCNYPMRTSRDGS